MTDLSKFSDNELLSLYSARPEVSPLAEMSDDDLLAAHKSFTTPAQSIAIDYGNQGSAAGQRTTPQVEAHMKNIVSDDVFQNDAGEILYRDRSGQIVPTDQNQHVALRDPADNRLKIFARTPQTNEGLLSAAGRMVISGLGSGAPTARPGIAAASAARAPRMEAVSDLEREGVTAISAGQKRGSKALQYAESTLGDALGAGGKATALNERASEQFTAAILRRAGIAGETRATPEVLSAAAERIGGQFDAIAARNKAIPLDGKFAVEAERVAKDFKNLTGQESPMIKEFLARIGFGARRPSTIAGDKYQSLQSEIGRYMRSSSSPELKNALGDLKDALDDAISRGLADPKDAAQWQEARRHWKNLMVIESAATGAGENAALGLISPAKLRQAVVAQGKRAYVRGQSDFARLAKAGNAVLGPLPQSGTAPRAAVNMLPGVVTGAGALAYLDPVTAALVGGAAAAPAVAGRAIMSRPMQAALSPSTPNVPARGNPLAELLLRGAPVVPRLTADDAGYP